MSMYIQQTKKYLPWQIKIIAKIILSHFPLQYSFWQKVRLFRHGNMDDPSFAYKKVEHRFSQIQLPQKQFVCLELGPGDSLLSGMVAYAFGATRSYLVDVGKFADHNKELYQSMASLLLEKGFSVPRVTMAQSISDVLDSYSIQYMTEGLSSLQKIPDQSVDFIWSQVVLEHVRRAEFLPVMKELRRIIRPTGICSHAVDLKDHLGGSLNNLRFSHNLWESNFMANSGFYTNRIQLSQMLSLFRQAGFEFSLTRIERWGHLPTPKRKLSKEFQHLSEEELCISEFDVMLYPTS